MSAKILTIKLQKVDNVWTFSSYMYNEKSTNHFKSSTIRKGVFSQFADNTIFVRSSDNKAEINDIYNFINSLNTYIQSNPNCTLGVEVATKYLNVTLTDYTKNIELGSVDFAMLKTHNDSSNRRLRKEIDRLEINYPRCEICGRMQEKLVDAINSIDEKYKACDNCAKTKKCIICKKPELINSVRNQTFLDDKGNLRGGKVSNYTLCIKCSSDFTRCGHRCGSYYDKNKYDICPCLVPHDFKKMILPYNADVTHTHSSDTFSIELFGVEIETGALYKQREKYQEIYNQTYDLVKNDAIMVYDSSIDYLDGSEKQKPNEYRGMEIVSRPMTYKNTLRFLRKFSKNRHPLLKSWEVGTAGIHIHTSKAALSRIQIGKLGLFINDKNNRDFLKLIAKREDKKYAKYLTRKLTDYADTSNECHYYALNTRKPHTIEFRIFRGTLNTVTLISYLQFFKSLIEFIKLAPNGITSSSEKNNLYYGDYIEWLRTTEKSQFRELKTRINNELRSNSIVEEGEI